MKAGKLAKRHRKTVQVRAKVLEGNSRHTRQGRTEGQPPRGGGGRPKCHRAEPGSLQDARAKCPGLRDGKIPSDHRLAQAQMTPLRQADCKSSPLGAGFGSLQAGPPPATSFAKFSAVPSTHRTLLSCPFQVWSGGIQERSKTCSEAMCPRRTLSLPPTKSGAQGAEE